MKLSQIRLITGDIHKSVAFYRDVMEFEILR
ncbi:VOC family protein [Paenibacillus dokdonensis]